MAREPRAPPRRYRLYVDESGDHTYQNLSEPAARYLGLTGVAVEVEYYRDDFQPALEELKQSIFPHSPDDPVVLVRNRIISRKGAFGRLKDKEVNAQWEKGWLDFLRRHQIRIFTVVIDKHEHREKYRNAAWHPYYYSMTVLMERYRGWLSYLKARGDVLAESRGRKEDRELQGAYDNVLARGTNFLSAQQFSEVLTSRKLKIKKKEHNIAGLQVADLLAFPSKVDVLASYGKTLGKPPRRFTAAINDVIRPKHNQYCRVVL